jgi:hypothetical protein
MNAKNIVFAALLALGLNVAAPVVAQTADRDESVLPTPAMQIDPDAEIVNEMPVIEPSTDEPMLTEPMSAPIEISEGAPVTLHRAEVTSGTRANGFYWKQQIDIEHVDAAVEPKAPLSQIYTSEEEFDIPLLVPQFNAGEIRLGFLGQSDEIVVSFFASRVDRLAHAGNVAPALPPVPRAVDGTIVASKMTYRFTPPARTENPGDVVRFDQSEKEAVAQAQRNFEEAEARRKAVQASSDAIDEKRRGFSLKTLPSTSPIVDLETTLQPRNVATAALRLGIEQPAAQKDELRRTVFMGILFKDAVTIGLSLLVVIPLLLLTVKDSAPRTWEKLERQSSQIFSLRPTRLEYNIDPSVLSPASMSRWAWKGICKLSYTLEGLDPLIANERKQAAAALSAESKNKSAPT